MSKAFRVSVYNIDNSCFTFCKKTLIKLDTKYLIVKKINWWTQPVSKVIINSADYVKKPLRTLISQFSAGKSTTLKSKASQINQNYTCKFLR